MASKSYENYRSLLANENVQRALATIRMAEGTSKRADPYRVGFGFRSIGHLDDHPREYNAYGKTVTSAAGAYQALERTWDDVDRRIGLPNFGPEAQDVFALAKIDDRRALDAVLKGDFDTFARRVSNEWASFPGNSYGQPTKSRKDLRAAWDSAKITKPVNAKADKRLADAWGYQDPNTVRGLSTPRGVPAPTLRQPTIDDVQVARGLPAPSRAPRPTLDGVQVARGTPAPTPASRGIMLSSAAPNTFATAYAPEPQRVGAVAAMPIASEEYDLPPTPTFAQRAAPPASRQMQGPPAPARAPLPTMGAGLGSLFAAGPPRELNPRVDVAPVPTPAPRGAPQLPAPVQAGLGPRQVGPSMPVQAAAATPAPAEPQRLAGFPTPFQRGAPAPAPRAAPQLAAAPVPDLTSRTLPGAAPAAPAGRPGVPTFGGPFASLAAAQPQAPVGVAGEQRVQPAAQRPAAPAAERMAFGPQMPDPGAPRVLNRPVDQAPIPTAAPRQTAAPAVPVSAPRQAGVTPAAIPESAPRAAAPAASPAPRAPAPEVTPYRSAPRQAGAPAQAPAAASPLDPIGDAVARYAPQAIGGLLGGALLGPVGAIAGGYLANKAFGGGPARAAGNGVTTGLLTGRAIPVSVLRDPARYGQGGYTGLGLPDAPRAPSQSQALKDRDRRGGRGDSGPAMSKSASDSIGKSGAGRGGLW